MMDNAIHYRHSDIILVEEFPPVGEILVGGDDHRAVLIQAVDQLKHVVDPLLVHRQIAQLIDDEQVKFQ